MFGHTQKMDVIVDRKLPIDLDSASIFSKVIGNKLYNNSSSEIYMRFSMSFAADLVQTQTLQLMDLGVLTINTLDEISGLSTLATKNPKAHGWCSLERAESYFW